MQKFSFFPGPSQLHKNFSLWVQKALNHHFLSIYHRTHLFSEIYQSIDEQFRIKLGLPKEFELYFVPSATEAWHITAHSLILDKALFFHNGNFGEKWYQAVLQNYPFATEISFGVNELPDIPKLSDHFVGIVHVETSNGSQIPNSFLEALRHQNPEACLVVDATSSMAGVNLPWQYADVWFASVQKCFGLPPGMAVLCVHSKAIQRAKQKNWQHYNGVLNLSANYQKWQTPNTPNLLNIWCLNEFLKEMPEIPIVEKILLSRKNQFLQAHPHLKPVSNAYLSTTVWAFWYEKATELHQKAQEAGLLLGKGYGRWADHTFRIANFPSIPNEAWVKLNTFFLSQ